MDGNSRNSDGKRLHSRVVLEIKETVQKQFALVTKIKKEIRKEENLINGILHVKNQIRIDEKTMPELEIQDILK